MVRFGPVSLVPNGTEEEKHSIHQRKTQRSIEGSQMVFQDDQLTYNTKSSPSNKYDETASTLTEKQ